LELYYIIVHSTEVVTTVRHAFQKHRSGQAGS
jgi:hypothetical protein